MFLGAIIRYLLENNAYFHDYVVHYTNAATLVSENYVDTGGSWAASSPVSTRKLAPTPIRAVGITSATKTERL